MYSKWTARRTYTLACLACTALAAPALAQPATRGDAEPIVVTAKQPSSDPLAYAGSVTVIDADEIEARQVQDLTALSFAAPNVSLDAIGTFRGVANFSVRGLGINSSIPSIDPAVALLVDGVYMGINAGTLFDTLDLSGIELLRGPQGVAFGRNTTGGAVLVTTADPTFHREAHARLDFETPVDSGRGGPMATARLIVSGPVSDNVAVRIGVLHASDGGYFQNDFNGGDFGKSETTVVRGGIAFDDGGPLRITVKGEYTDSHGDGATTHNNGQNARDRFDLAVDQEGFYYSENRFVMARAEYDVGRGQIVNLFGWRKYDLDTRNDIDSSPIKIFESDTATAQEQFSNELYYAADYGRLSLIAGAYVLSQDIGYDETRDLSAFGLQTYYGGGRQDQEVFGLYSQADFDLADALTITAGLRWSREEKSAAITYVRPRPACSPIAQTCPTSGERVDGENNGFTDKRAWTSLSPKLALAWRISEDASAYASWARGYRSGGYNLRITQPEAFEEVSTALGSPAFDEERVDSFEIGAKWMSGDGRARLAAALFWNEVDNLQREVNVASLSSGLAQSVYNTADARIRGGEIEAEFALSPILTLTANVGYTDAEYRRVFFDISGDGAIGAADLALELPRAPKWTWGGSAHLDAPLHGKVRVIGRVDFQHRDRYAYTDNNFGYTGAIDMLDASIGFDLGDPGIRVTLFGKNLLDEIQFGGDTQLPFAGGPFSDGIGRPFDPAPAAGTFSPIMKGRRLGLQLAMDF